MDVSAKKKNCNVRKFTKITDLRCVKILHALLNLTKETTAVDKVLLFR